MSAMLKSCLPFPWRAILSALAIYSSIQLVFLGLAPVAGSSEAREAQVIENIVRDGEWILPLRNGIVPSKPPLYHWIGASLSASVGSVSELTARLPSHLSAVGVLLCAALCAYALARGSCTTESALHPQRVTLLAAGILSLTYGFHQLATQAMVDMTFSLCVWCALASLACGTNVRDGSRDIITARARTLFWVSCSLGVLARGPLGMVLPVFLALVSGAWLVGPRAALREVCRPSLGWVAMLLPVAWYCAAYSVGGAEFLARQLLFENVQRVIGGEKIHTEAWWFYGPSLLRTTFPWGVLMLVGLIVARPRSGVASYRGEQVWRIILLPSVLLVAGVMLFSLSSGKRHSYMLPLLPLVAMQLALLSSSLLECGGHPARLWAWMAAKKAEALLCLACIALLVVAGLGLHGEWRADPIEALVKFAVGSLTTRMELLLLAALVLVFLLSRARAWMLYSSVWGLMMLLMTIVVSSGAVIKGTLKGFPLMTEQLLLLSDGDKRIVFIKDPFDEYFDPFFFYLHRDVEISNLGEGPLPCEPEVVYVMRRKLLEQKASATPGSIREMAVLQETLHALRRDGKREISVFTCGPTGYPDESGKVVWFEA